MSKTLNVLLAGFGGQGILFAGKTIAYSGLMDNKEISCLPSFGPEMRGGTCNCSVVTSEESIGSPLVTQPDVLIAMNLPSLDKFVDAVVPGGTILVDSYMISKKVERTDVNVYYIDATKIADAKGLKGCAIIILVGKMFKEVGFCTKEALDKGIQKVIPAKKAAMLGLNQEALKIGMES